MLRAGRPSIEIGGQGVTGWQRRRNGASRSVVFFGFGVGQKSVLPPKASLTGENVVRLDHSGGRKNVVRGIEISYDSAGDAGR